MTDLWHYSCEYYQQDGIKEACLVLQDKHQMQVNLLMLMRYLGKLRYQVKSNQILDLLKSTQSIVRKVELIRGVRRSLNSKASGALWDDVYQKLKQAELEAEKIHIEFLNHWVLSLSNSSGSTAEVVNADSFIKHNVLAYWAVQQQLDAEKICEDDLPTELLLLAC